MKLPLKFGIPLLAILWIGSSAADDPQIGMALRVAAIGAALWTAFSLPIPKSRPPAMEEDEQPSVMPGPDFLNEQGSDSSIPGDAGEPGQRRKFTGDNDADGGNGIDRGNDPVATLLPGEPEK